MKAVLTTLLLLAGFGGCGISPFAAEESAEDASPTQLQSQVQPPTPNLETPNAAAPPYFRISGGPGATLHVLGTVHLGPEDGWDFAAPIDRGLASADAFIMEIDVRSLDENAVGSVLARRVILPVSTELPDVVSPETAKLIDENDALITSLGVPPLARRRMKPWYLAVNLLQVAISRTPFTLAAAAENQIVSVIGDRPLEGLETFEEQLGFFDSLSPALQDLLLRDSLGRLDETAAEMEILVEAWKTGDRAALEEISRQGIDEYPDLEGFYDLLLHDRNERWTASLKMRLDDPAQAGTNIFVAVGALHLIGDDGVPAMLEAAGYEITPLF